MTVYPCVYREHYVDPLVVLLNDGLSLCIQGTPVLSAPYDCGVRFIPVYTGNTKMGIKHLSLMWFIPVYTGNTFNIAIVCGIHSVYPCVYREHV